MRKYIVHFNTKLIYNIVWVVLKKVGHINIKLVQIVPQNVKKNSQSSGQVVLKKSNYVLLYMYCEYKYVPLSPPFLHFLPISFLRNYIRHVIIAILSNDYLVFGDHSATKLNCHVYWYAICWFGAISFSSGILKCTQGIPPNYYICSICSILFLGHNHIYDPLLWLCLIFYLA